MAEVRLFTNDREAVFLRRPNRFLIVAGDTDEELACHCPNPGRLLELLFPGSRLILERRVKQANAKTAWTAAGLYHGNTVVPLASFRANLAAEKLILYKIIPNLREFVGEYTLGPSRFDFLCIDKRGGKHLVEVKACSLIEHGVAMFPDAPSGRALKHLEELAALSSQGYQCHMLFVIVHSNPIGFIPNLHTDPAFAAGLSRYGHAVHAPTGIRSSGIGPVVVHAALLRCNQNGLVSLVNHSVPVNLSHGALAESNGGNYLVLLELPKDRKIAVAALGTLNFPRGWYAYAGSARKNLSQRISRHLRKERKLKHWHLDYLTPHAKTIQALPIASYRNLECTLAGDLRKLGGRTVKDFGSSDCHCPGHLCYFPEQPLSNPAFVDLLMRYRHVEALINHDEKR
jgi:sugar fermentation stimulation protein A